MIASENDADHNKCFLLFLFFLKVSQSYKNAQGQNCRGTQYMRQNEFETKGSQQNVWDKLIAGQSDFGTK